MEPIYHYFIVDIDGFRVSNGRECTEFPKEIGYFYFRGEVNAESGSIFCRGGPQHLSESQTSSQREKHGLPLEGFEVVNSLLENHLFHVNEMEQAIQDVVHELRRKYHVKNSDSFFVCHKGGAEGRLLKKLFGESRNRGIFIKNLENYGCPKYDELVKQPRYLHEALRSSNCNRFVNHRLFDEENGVRRFVHCPQMECIVFGRWFIDECLA